MELYLIRHGRTNENIKGVYLGSSNPSLDKKGIEESYEIKNKLKNIDIFKVYSSPLNRCKETAEIIFQNSEIEEINELKEIDFGVWEGKSYKEISNEYSSEFQKFIDNYRDFQFPEGENFKEFYERVKKVIWNIKKSKLERVAIVAHEGTLRVILCNLLGIGIDGFYKLKIQHGCFTKINVYENDCQLEVLNK